MTGRAALVLCLALSSAAYAVTLHWDDPGWSAPVEVGIEGSADGATWAPAGCQPDGQSGTATVPDYNYYRAFALERGDAALADCDVTNAAGVSGYSNVASHVAGPLAPVVTITPVLPWGNKQEPPTMALSTTPDFWWKLDETSGSVAVNSGDYGTPSDYNGTVFANGTGSTAWLGSSETWGSGGIQGGIELSPVGSTGDHATGVNINTNLPLDGLKRLTLSAWSENDGTGARDGRLFFTGRTWQEAGHLVMLGYYGFEDIRTRINGATQLDAAGNEYTTAKVHWTMVIDYTLGTEQLKLYKDGVKVYTVDDLPGTEIDESLATDGSGGFVSIIGASTGSNSSLRGNSFGGKIADMRVWLGQAATDSEVNAIMDDTLGGSGAVNAELSPGQSTGIGQSAVPAIGISASLSPGQSTGIGQSAVPAIGISASLSPGQSTGIGKDLVPSIGTSVNAELSPGQSTGIGQSAVPAIGISASLSPGQSTGIGKDLVPSIGTAVNAELSPGQSTGIGQSAVPAIGISASLSPGQSTGIGKDLVPSIGGAVNAELSPGQSTGIGKASVPAIGVSASLSPGQSTGIGKDLVPSIGGAVNVELSPGQSSGIGKASVPAIGVSAALSPGQSTGIGKDLVPSIGGAVNVELSPGQSSGIGKASVPAIGISAVLFPGQSTGIGRAVVPRTSPLQPSLARTMRVLPDTRVMTVPSDTRVCIIR